MQEWEKREKAIGINRLFGSPQKPPVSPQSQATTPKATPPSPETARKRARLEEVIRETAKQAKLTDFF